MHSFIAFLPTWSHFHFLTGVQTSMKHVLKSKLGFLHCRTCQVTTQSHSRFPLILPPRSVCSESTNHVSQSPNLRLRVGISDFCKSTNLIEVRPARFTVSSSRDLDPAKSL
ncbi:hypothetical protein BCV70DRAFT_23831 [Testicularia cyperi]|uniref:Uncharacterized protein n=1 Tax=Testicularia cyperi TaxID=1882483 RepID=A0A317XZV6_9BASI|nr:hypothetical protein BCV70DRAFT_23831 [Testicularia cyperi]